MTMLPMANRPYGPGVLNPDVGLGGNGVLFPAGPSDYESPGFDLVGQSTPQMPEPQAKQGLLGRISSTPGASRALIALGAGMLSGNSFFDGLAKGGLAYQDAVDTESAMRRPKVQFLANGAVQAVTDPTTGKTVYETTPAKQALADIIQTRGDEQRKTQGVKDDAAWKRTAANIDGRREVAGLNNDSRERVAGANITSREHIADGRNKTSIRVAEIGQDGKDKDREVKLQLGSTKPAPPSAMAKYQELYSQNDNYEQVMKNGQGVVDMIESGQLPLSIAHNAKQEIALATGMGADVGTQRYALYKQFKESLRNAYLMAAKGVQTDGDAERAMREIESGSGDPGSVKANLDVILNFINRRRDVAKAGMEFYEHEYGIGDADDEPKPKARTRPKAPTSGAVSGVTWKLK